MDIPVITDIINGPNKTGCSCKYVKVSRTLDVKQIAIKIGTGSSIKYKENKHI